MPRSLQEILDHADELARKFEQFEPDGPGLDSAPLHAIRDAVIARSESERDLIAAVHAAREAGMPWVLIGSMLGTSGEAARQRYGEHPKRKSA
jgi:hypothetical protein